MTISYSDDIETAIQTIVDEMNSPIITIPGIGYCMGAMILAEIGDFSRFDSPDKILAYAGMSPSTYQSGQLTSTYAHLEKRGSRYLRYALFNATKFVCNRASTLSVLVFLSVRLFRYRFVWSGLMTKVVRPLLSKKPIGSDLCGLSCQKTLRGQTLQRRHLPRCQEARAPYLRLGEVRATVQSRGVVPPLSA